MTGCIFLILAIILVADDAPGRSMLLHKTGAVVLAPLLWIVELTGRLRLWSFSEKADLALAVLLGSLTLLVSLLYATLITMILKLMNQCKSKSMPNIALHGSGRDRADAPRRGR